ncbi:hypothetical protein [Gordonia sp. SND2]|uniref:hypothetical protein n=1 Tax=Gordonia sp. SND2 TaxID=3388659 RepID=UPI00398B5B41
MTWFKVDDSFHDHPKVLNLDLAAVGLWTLAGSYCARHLLDGVISDRQIRAIGGTRRQAEKLVAAGLWSVHRDDADAAPSARRYVFNDWTDFQPTRADVTTKRREDAERKREARARRTQDNKRNRKDQQEWKNVREDVQPDAPVDVHAESSRARGRAPAPAPASRPDPTRPDRDLPPPSDDEPSVTRGPSALSSSTFSDGTPIPPEPPADHRGPATDGTAALAYDAEIIPLETGTAAKPKPARAEPVHRTFVRTILGGAGYPRATIDQLATQVAKLSGKHPTDLIADALREWDRRPAGTIPAHLPTVLGDVVKARRAHPEAPKSKLRTLAELTHQERLAEQHTTRKAIE